MTKTFTQYDLIRYLYLESSSNSEKTLEKALFFDSNLQTQYKELSEMKRYLTEIELQPSEESIQAILNYARQKEQQQ